MGRVLQTLPEGGTYFEGPRWHDGRWFVSDVYRNAVFAIDPAGEAEEFLRFDGEPSGLGWLPDGSLLVVSKKDRRVLHRSPDGELTVHADVAEHCGGDLNDMVISTGGRLTDRRVWAQVAETPPLGPIEESLPKLRFSPDGIAIDAEEHVWAADALFGRVARGGARRRGRRRDPRPPRASGSSPACSAATTAARCCSPRAPDFAEENRRNAREAVLLTTTVDVPHAGLP